MSSEGKLVVCVTGASGFVASWIVKTLLLRGYTVHATARDPNDTAKVKHLMEFEGAKERLHFFKADLLDEGSFDDAVTGCHGVFHTASPVILKVNDPQVDILEPAVKGTLNVLTSCKKIPSIKRIILTSSVAAIVYTGLSRAPDVLVDETWFSKPEIIRKLEKPWYALSKTLAEEAAWKFVKENDLDMVSIIPGMCIGPMLQPSLNASVALISNLINGATTYANEVYTWVDIRDVATAHILAFENPSAHGRYCMWETVAHFSDIVQMLRELYPNLTLPAKCADNEPLAPLFLISKKRANSLGVEFSPLKPSLRDTVENLKQKGFVSF